jgi:thiol-disulfide isomerase/thioredoxin
MKWFPILLAALAAGPVMALKPGDEVGPAALGKAELIQGGVPAEWEPGKVYVLECWATWCGPCLAAIPHVNDLHKKFSAQGLRVIGVNVWEDGKDKVAKFVAGKGEGMAYPVVYVGRGGAFEEEWLKAAGVRGIPHAFVVRDGKLLFTTHPMGLSDEIVGDLVAGGERAEKAAARVSEAAASRERLSALAQDFRKAKAAKDVAAMKAGLGELEKLPEAARLLPMLRLDLAVAAEDWDGATAQLGALEGANKLMVTRQLAMEAAGREDMPEGFRRALLEAAAAMAGDLPRPDPFLAMARVRLHWGLGEQDQAKAVAAAMAGEKYPEMLAGPVKKFAAEVAEGRLPASTDFAGWVNEGRAKPTTTPPPPPPAAE